MARATGTSVLEAAATGGASIAMTARAGRGPQPLGEAAGAGQPDPVEQAGLGAQLRSSVRSGPCVNGPRTRPGTATSPCSSCRVASIRHSAVSASGIGPPNRPLCTPWRSVRDLHDRAGAATQRGGQRGHLRGPVHRVGEHHHVGPQPVVEGIKERLERGRADLLLALDQHRYADREVVAVGAQGGQVHGQAGLVVGGATAVEPAVPDLRMEGIGVPAGAVAGRLDVVVRVQQHGRGTGWAGAVGQHRGLAAACLDDLDLGQPGLAQQSGDLAGALGQLRGGGRVGGHRRDRNQALQVGADPGQDTLDGGADWFGVGDHGLDATSGSRGGSAAPDHPRTWSGGHRHPSVRGGRGRRRGGGGGRGGGGARGAAGAGARGAGGAGARGAGGAGARGAGGAAEGRSAPAVRRRKAGGRRRSAGRSPWPSPVRGGGR